MDTDVVERYLLLGLRLGRHIDGLVDAYYGPPELAKRVMSEQLIPPADLAQEAAALRDAASTLDDPQRARWLSAQLDGLAATAERLDGRPIGYVEEIERCYGVAPEPATENELAEAHRRLEELVPGTGSLRARYQAWRRAREIRTRTQALFGLPEGEAVELELVSDQPWSGFNHYLGGLRSRIAINTDIPVHPDFLVLVAAHETYPGHHTEHAWKEALLVRDRDRLEESILLIGTPQSLISEGIASCALGALGVEAKHACESLLADLGWGYDVGLSRAVREVERPLGRVWHNVALMIHEDGRGADEARAFADRWVLTSEKEIAKRLEFILHPVWRAYIVVYGAGERLVEAWTRDDLQGYRRLLTEQMTTGDIVLTDG